MRTTRVSRGNAPLRAGWDFRALEDRLLLSAAPAAVVQVAEPAPTEVDAAALVTELATESAAPADEPTAQPVSHELVIIDADATDIEQLIADLQTESDADRELSYIVLDPARDGIEQVTEALAQYTTEKLDAVHFVTHGTDRAVKLGGVWLDAATFSENQALIETWSHALTADADLLFYGCELASTEVGQSLLQSLADATGADVAASTNDTGWAAYDADWVLEYAVGVVETDVAFSATVMADWQGLLNTFTVTKTADDGTSGTLRWAIQQANGLAGFDTITFNITGAGPHTITLSGGLGALPTITEAVLIDGWSEPDYSSTTGLPVIVLDGVNTTGANGIHITASGVTVRGLVINRFDASGLYIQSGNNNVIQGTFIGTDATGNALMEAAGSMADGIQVRSANNLIGGNTLQTRNVIGGTQDAIRIRDTTASGNIIRGNYLGVGANGTANIGNTDDGVDLGTLAANTVVGGTGSGEGNVIANNSGHGVEVRLDAGTGNAILSNLTYNNGGFGIDLANNGVTANDAGDPDSGANNLQNFPVLAAVGTDGSRVAVAGSINTTANTTLRLEFFATDVAAAGNGEGRTFLGFANVITDNAGNSQFIVDIDVALAAGQYVTATATVIGAGGVYGSTSEFSANVAAASALIVDTFVDTITGSNTSSVTNLLANKGADGKISLREAILATNNTTGVQSIFLPAGNYGLALTGTGEELAATGDLDIRDALILVGASAASTTIDGQSIDRVLHVQNNATAYVSNVTIQGGLISSSEGAGIRTAGSTTLVMSEVVVANNAATAINAFGGGIYNLGTVYFDSVWVHDNSAQLGGGISNDGIGLITNTTISANTAEQGGGIKNVGNGLQLVNVTISGNTATTGPGQGGGIHTAANLYLTNVTVSANTALQSGGIHEATPANNTYLKNTIVSGNSAGTGANTDSTLEDLGNNLINGTPLLGALAANGGFAPTHALLAGSPAINAGTSSGAPFIDQRGQLRASGAVDIGAVEFAADGLVGHYKLDEGGGTTAIDSSSYGANGTHIGSPVYATGILSGAVNYSGDFDRTEVADPTDGHLDFGAGNFTVAFWVNSSITTAGNARLIGKSTTAGYTIYRNGADLLFEANDGSSFSQIRYQGVFDGAWHHVAAIRNGNDFMLLVDGNLVGVQTLAIGSISNAETLRFAAFSSSSSDFDGRLDDIRLYNRKLSFGEVNSLISAGSNTPPQEITFDSDSTTEQQVNTYTTSDQFDSAITALPNGGYVVVWTSNGQDSSGYGIYAQRYDAAGAKVGGEILVTGEQTDSETGPSVSAFSDGGFVVAWQDQTSGVYAWTEARVFNADGTAATAEFKVSPGVDGNNEGYQPAVQVLDANRFVVVWSNEVGGTSYDVVGRIYNRSGVLQGSQFTIGSLINGTALFGAQPEVALLNDGGFAVVWRTNDGVSLGTRMRIMNSDGSARSAETTLGGTGRGDVAVLENGNVVFIYNDGADVQAVIYSAAGAVVVSEFTVNVTAAAIPGDPTVTRSDDGFVVGWVAASGDGSGSALLARRFSSTGAALSGEVLINQTTTGDQLSPEAIETAGGQVRFAWHSQNIDGDGYAVVSRAVATGTASVVENAANGTRVADVIGVLDLSSADTHTFTLTNSAGGRFAINAATGVITVANGSLLDYETATSHAITVRATDSSGATFDKVLTISVTNVDDNPPTLSVSGAATVTAGGTYTLNLSASDPEGVAITSWTINWGDGSIQTVAGNPSSVTHVYATALTGHTLNISVAATDPTGTYFQNRLYVPSWFGTDLVHIYQGQSGSFVGTMAPITDGLNDHIEVIQGPNGNLYISSEQSDSVLEYTTAGVLVRTFVSPGSGGLNGSAGLAFGGDGNLYVANYLGNNILRYNGTTGAFIGIFVASGTGGLSSPLGLNFGPDGKLYVASRGGNTILRFAANGIHDATFSGAVGGYVEDFTFGPDGHIYAADASNARIVKLNGSTGASMGAFVTSGSGGLSYPAGLAFGPDGRLYVSDQGNDAIRVYNGTTGAYIGDYVAPGYGGLDSPAYITFGASQRVQVLSSSGASQALPGPQTTNEDTAITFSTDNANAITVDDGTTSTFAPLQVSLSVPSGTLTLPTTTGLSFVGGANGTSGMVIWGTEADINTALNGLIFTPGANFNGSVNLSVTTALANGLQGHYEFENSGTPGLDTSVGVLQNGTPQGNATVVVDGARGNVLALDGDGDYIQIGGLFGNPANVTLAAWVNLTARDTGGSEVISLGNNVILRLDQPFGGVTGVFYNGSDWVYLSSNQFLAGTGWHHVAFTFDDVNNIQRLYIDGVVAVESSSTISISSTGGVNSYIGRHGSGTLTDWDFNGRIDDARIYTRALSAAEIAAIAAGNHTASGNVAVTVTAVNDQPVFGNLNNTPTYTEGGSAVVLDADVTIADAELSAANNFTGATLTLDRNGGANAQDQLAFDGVTVTTSGANVSVSGVQVGTYSFTAGQLTVTFGANATQARVNTLLQNIVYWNSSDSPPASVQINWTFNDGNSGAQGSGGALQATGSTTVAITSVNDAPSALSNTLAVFEDGFYTFAASNFNFSDVDGHSFLSLVVSTAPASGTLFLDADGDGEIDAGEAVAASAVVLVSDINAGRFKYRPNPNVSGIGADSFTYQVRDDGGTSNGGVNTDPTPNTISFNVTPVNDAPVVTTTGTPLAYMENQAATAVDGGLTVSDVDNANLSSATVAISNNYVNGQDVLAFTNQLGITGSWDSATGVLTLTGTTTVANYQTALRSVTFVNTSDNPSTLSRTVSFVVSDGAVNSTAATRTITLTTNNDAPIVTTSGGSAQYNENAAPVAIDGALTVSDADNTDLTGATVRVSAGYVNGQDVLSFTNQLGIAGSWDANTGTLTLTGTATIANYQTALRSIRYHNTSENPNITPRTVEFIVNDGAAASVAATRDVQVVSWNDEPTTNAASAGGNEDATSIAVTITGGDVDGTVDRFRVTALPGNGTLYLDAGLTTAVVAGTDYNATAESLTLYFVPEADWNGVASFQYAARDAAGLVDSTPAIATITVAAVNDAPVIVSSSGLNSIAEDDVANTGTLISQLVAITMTDVDNDPLGIAITSVDTTNGSWEYTLNGTTWISVGTPSTTAALLLPADANTRIRFVPNANFNGVSGLVFYKAWDQTTGTAGGTANVTTSGGTTAFSTGTNGTSVSVSAVNDAPVVTTTGTALAYTENQAATAIDSGLTVSDVDNTNLAGATVTISGNYANGQDVLAFTNQLGITGSWNAATGVLTLTGTATVANYQTALRSITYVNISDNPSTLTRTVSLVVNDGSANSTAATRGITVLAVNDAPVLSTSPTPTLTAVLEDSGAPSGAVGTLISNLIDFAVPAGGYDNVTDADSTLTGVALRSASTANGTWYYSTNNGANWNVVGAVSDANSLLLAADANTRLYFAPNSNFSGWMVNAISFRAWDQSTGVNGDYADASVNGGSTAFSAAMEGADLTVTPVNDAPVITTTGTPLAYTENQAATAVDGALTVSDVDSTNLTGATVTISGNYASGQDVLAFTSQLGITGNWNAATGILTLTGTTTVANYQTALRSITYFNTSNNPSTASRTVSFVVNDGTANSTAATRTITVTAVNDAPTISGAPNVFINEFHYDNSGTDTGEAIEIAGAAGTDLTGWTLLLYNGNGGALYDTVAISGTIPNQVDDFGTIVVNFPSNGIENGDSSETQPDGIALVDDAGNVVEFLSYEGTFIAVGGAADGMTSTNIGVVETATTPVGYSLQRTGAGPTYTWATEAVNTFGTVNSGQSFASASQWLGDESTPEEFAITFGVATNNAITIGDVDADDGAADPLEVTLTVLNGTLTLGSIAGLSNLSGDGTSVVTFQGSVAEVNSALELLTYQPHANYAGTDTLTIQVNDQGNTGSGSVETDTSFVAITITAVNDVPIRTAGSVNNLTVLEDSGLTSLGLGGVAYAPGGGSDEAGQTLTYTVTAIPSSAFFGDIVLADGTTVVTVGSTYTLADIQGMQLRTTLNQSGVSLFQFNVQDSGGTANGGADSLAQAILLTITAVNDPPIHTVPGTQTVVEETQTAITGISIADADAGASTITTRLQVTNGVLNVTLAGGATFSTGTNGSADFTLSGTRTAINSTLASLLYTGNLNVTGVAADTLTITTNDGGNTGSGGAQQDVDTVQIDITSTNDPPSITFGEGNKTYVENGSPLIIDGSITVTDADLTDFAGGQLTVNVPVNGSGDDRIGITAGGNITVVTGPNEIYHLGTLVGTWTGSGAPFQITFNSNASLAIVQQVARQVTFHNLSDTPSTATRTVQFVLTDGDGGTSAAITKSIDVTAVNDEPTLDLNGGGAGIHTAATFTEGDAPVTLAAAATVGDLGENDLTTLSLLLSGMSGDGAAERIRFGAVTVPYGTAVSGTVTFGGTTFAYDYDGDQSLDFTRSGGGTIPWVDLQLLARGISYEHTSQNPTAGVRTVAFTVRDAGNAASIVTNATINVVAVNDLAGVTVSGGITIDEDTSGTMSISVNDVDLNGGDLLVSLSLANNRGTFSLATITGLNFTVGDGSDNNAMTFTGLQAAVNAALATITFTATSDVTGVDTLQYSISDQGATGSGGAQVFTGGLGITIRTVNDAPVRTAGTLNNLVVAEDSGLTSLGLGGLTYGPGGGSDEAGQTLTYQVIATPLATLGHIVKADGVTVVSAGNFLTLAEVQGLQWRTANNAYGGPGTFTLRVTDNGTTNGAADPKFLAESLTIAVSAVNDAPVNTHPAGVTTNEDTAVSFTGPNAIQIADVDENYQTLRVQLSVGPGGLLTLGDATGLTFLAGDGSDDASMTFTGSLDDINTALLTLTFEPMSNFAGSVNFTITTNDLGNTGADPGATGDASSEQDSDSFVITVNAVNDGPVLNAPAGPLAATEQTSLDLHGIGFSLDDLDAGSGVLTLTLSVGEGALTIAAGDSGITIQSGNGSGSVVITGTSVDLDNLLTGTSTGTITYFNNSNTPSASTLLTLTVNDGGNTGADPGLTGDGSSEEDSASLTINITAVNDPPVQAVRNDANVETGGSVTLTAAHLLATDLDHAATQLTYTITLAPADGVLRRGLVALGIGDTFTQQDIADGLVTYTHGGGSTATDALEFTLSDGVATLPNDKINFLIGDATPPFVVVNAGSTVLEEGTDTITQAELEYQDLGGGPATITYAITGGLANGHLARVGAETTPITSFTQQELNAGDIVYVHGGGENTFDSFTFNVEDGAGNSATGLTFAITVTPQNDPPTASAGGPYTIAEGAGLTLSAAGSSDVDGGPLTYAWDLDNDGQFDDATGVGPTLTWAQLQTLGINDNGTYTIGVRVSDGNGGITTASTTLTVTNTAPTANDDGGAAFTTTEEAQFVTGNVLTNDTDPASGDTLAIISINTTGTQGTVTNNGDGTFTYDPNGLFETLAAGQSATDTFAYTISDGDGGFSTATVTITINGANDAPTASAGGPYTIAEGAGLTLNAAGSSDIEGQVLTYDWDLDNDGQYDDATGVGPTLTWGQLQSLGINDNGTYTLGVRVTDAQGASATAGTTLTVTNTAPTANDDAGIGYTTDEDNPFTTIDVRSNDVEPAAGDPLAIVSINTTGTVGLVTNNGDGTFTYDPNGLFETLAAGQSATDTFAYTISDGDGGFSTATVTITINGANDAPTASAGGPYTIAEGAGLTLNASGSSDIEGQVLTYDWDLDNDGQYDDATGVGPTLTWGQLQSLGINDNGTYTLGVRVTDAQGGVSTATTTLTVTNTQPTANDDGGAAFTTSEDAQFVTGNVLTNDSDPASGDTLSVSSINTTGTLGLVTNNGDGTFIYNPNGQFEGLDVGETATDTFTYTISDGDGGFSTATVTITITGANDAPTVTSIANQTVNEDGTLGPLAFTIGDIDVEPLTVTAVSNNQTIIPDGNITLSGSGANRTITLSPAADQFGGPVTITITVSDGTTTTQTTFTVTVLAANDPPVQTAIASATISEGNSLNLSAGTWSDIDGGPLTYTWDIDGDGTFGEPGEPTGASPTISWATLQSLGVIDQGNYTFFVRANDGNGGVTTGTFNLTVNNTAPTAVNDGGVGYTTNEDSAFTTLDVRSNDSDPATGDPLTIVSIDTTGTLGLVINNGDGTFTYNPNGQFETLAAGQSATDTFAYTISDGDGGFSTATVTITINGANDAPTASAGGPYTIAEGAGLTLNASGSSDIEGQVLTYDWDLDNDGQYDDATGVGPTLTWGQLQSLGINDNGTYTLGVRVTDVQGGVSTAGTTLTVTNTPPTAVNDGGFGYATSEDAPFTTVDVRGNDSDPAAGDPLTVVSVDTTGTLGTVVNNGDGTFTYNPNGQFETLAAGQTATDTFTYTISDGDGGFSTATVTIAINGANDAPTASAGGPYTIAEGAGLTLAASGSADVEGQALTYAWDLDNDGQYDDATGVGPTLTWAQLQSLGINDNGTYTLSVQVTDAQGGVSTATTTLTVTNTPPTANDDGGAAFTTSEDAQFVTGNILTNDTDPASGDPLSITSINTTGTLGLVTNHGDGTFTYDPNGQFEGLAAGQTATDTFTYTISDGDGGFSTATVTITITGVNDAPVVGNANYVLAENSPNGTVVGTLSASDPDAADVLTWSIVGGNTGGAFAIDASTGEITVANSALLDYEGLSTFALTIQVVDNGTPSLSDTATVTIQLTDLNDNPPVIAAGQASTLDENQPNGTVVGTVVATDLDAVGTLQNWQIVGGTGAGAFAIDAATGILSVADGSQLDFETTAAFTLLIQVTDGVNTSAVEQVTINLLDANDNRPTIPAGQSFTLAENSPNGLAVGQLTAMDVDTVGSLQNWTIVGGTGASVFALDAATGAITVIDGAWLNFEATPTLTLQVTVSDGVQAALPAVVMIQLTNVNEAPQLPTPAAVTLMGSSTAQGSSPGLLLGASDPDADAVSAVLVQSANHGTVTVNADGSWTYVPTAGFAGNDQFLVAATDGQLSSAPVVVRLTVQGASPPPAGDNTPRPTPETNDPPPEEGSPRTPAGVNPVAQGATTTNSSTGGSSGATAAAAVPAASDEFAMLSRELESLLGGDELNDKTLLHAQQVLNAAVYQQLHAAGVQALQSTLDRLGVDGIDDLQGLQPHLLLPRGGELWQALDTLSGDLDRVLWDTLTFENLVVGTSAAAATGLSVGYVVWLLRGGSLMITMVTALPTWMSFDPLPILGLGRRGAETQGDEESLAEMIQGQTRKLAAARAGQTRGGGSQR